MISDLGLAARITEATVRKCRISRLEIPYFEYRRKGFATLWGDTEVDVKGLLPALSRDPMLPTLQLFVILLLKYRGFKLIS